MRLAHGSHRPRPMVWPLAVSRVRRSRMAMGTWGLERKQVGGACCVAGKTLWYVCRCWLSIGREIRRQNGMEAFVWNHETKKNCRVWTIKLAFEFLLS